MRHSATSGIFVTLDGKRRHLPRAEWRLERGSAAEREGCALAPDL